MAGPNSLFDMKGTILILFLILLYFMWMDVALYYKIQAKELNRPFIEGQTSAQTKVTSSTPPPANMGSLPSQQFSPFNGLSVKLMMLDQPNHYIHTPAAQLFNQVTRFSERVPFITPNMISFFHVFVALVSMFMVMSDSLFTRQVGVLVFEFRSFLDALDGIVYRSRVGQTKFMSNFGSIGYIVDGVADALGVAFLMLGCSVYLRRSPLIIARHQSFHYLPIKNGAKTRSTQLESGSVFVVGFRHICGIIDHFSVNKFAVWVCFCYGLQVATSAFFWDRYIGGYHDLLESEATTEHQAALQTEVMKSASMWIIMWFWRIANAHALVEILLVSIYLDRLADYLLAVQYIGFAVTGILVVITEVHMHDVKNYIGLATFSHSTFLS